MLTANRFIMLHLTCGQTVSSNSVSVKAKQATTLVQLLRFESLNIPHEANLQLQLLEHVAKARLGSSPFFFPLPRIKYTDI